MRRAKGAIPISDVISERFTDACNSYTSIGLSGLGRYNKLFGTALTGKPTSCNGALGRCTFAGVREKLAGGKSMKAWMYRPPAALHIAPPLLLGTATGK